MRTTKKTILALARNIFIISPIIFLPAHAALPGFYVGGQIGWGNTGYNTAGSFHQAEIKSVGRVKDSGLAGRAFLGYQVNENWASEFGYTQFSRTRFYDVNGILNHDGNINEYAFDAVAKGIFPLCHCFSVFAKLGVAYIKANASEGFCNDSEFNPVLGAGIGYDLTPHIPVGVSYTRIQRVGGSIPSTNLATFDIAYNFG